MAGPIPTKKIPQLTALGTPLQGVEQLEIWVANTSRRITARDFVLPIDSVLTVVNQTSVLPGSRYLTSSATVSVIDGGAGGPVTLNALLTGALPGNPTASVGLVAVNGVAPTWMRSDAAPPLSQAIVPTWTGAHTFAQVGDTGTQAAIRIVSNLPQINLLESDGAVDNRLWVSYAQGENLFFATRNDVGLAGNTWLFVSRTGIVVDSIELASTSLLWNSSAVLTTATAFANPTGTVGLTAVNGVATTAMRSDAAPALSQAIAPTWTAQHTFGLSGATNAAILVSSAQPQVDWNETDAAANNRRWRFEVQSEQLLGRVVNDANSAAVSWLVVDRTANTIDAIALTSTALTWNGNALLSTATAFANPTGTVGLTAVNGVATTAMRSDAAPPLSQAIAPTWTAQHVFSLAGTTATPTVRLSATRVDFEFNETDAAADNRRWFWRVENEQFSGYISNDASGTTNSWVTVDRTGTVLDQIVLRAARVDVTNPAAAAVDFFLNDASSAANERLWRLRGNAAGQLQWAAANDALSTVNSFMLVDRTGATVDSVAFPTATVASFFVGTSASVGLGGVLAHFLAPSANNAIVAKSISQASACIVPWNNATAGDNSFIEFGTEVVYTSRGSITYNRAGGVVAYNTTSDVRRKKNIRDAPEASSIIDSIKVRSFEWTDSNNTLDYWVVAQELHRVFPLAVTVGADDKDWAVDPGKLIPLLVKELQSVRKRLAVLER